MKSKKEKAEYLLDELGGIGDYFVEEAAHPVKKKKRSLHLLGGIAAAIAVCFVIGGGGRALLGRSHDKVSEQADYSVSGLLTGRGGSGMPDFHNGKAKVIWQEAEGEIRFCEITGEQYRTLSDKSGAERLNEAESSEITLRLWLCDENGIVSSPYLLSESGNSAPAHLFSYSPEILPSDRFFRNLELILV